MSFHTPEVLVISAVFAGASAWASSVSARPPSSVIEGTVTNSDHEAATAGLVVISSVETGRPISTLPLDKHGRFRGPVAPGVYAVTATTDKGFAWMPRYTVPSADATLQLVGTCHMLRGRVDGRFGTSIVHAERHSDAQGDIFALAPDREGRFAGCIPDGQYDISLVGEALTALTRVDVPSATDLQIRAFPTPVVMQAPPQLSLAGATRDRVLLDIEARQPRLIGLGEATHGTSEFFAARSAFTMELIQHASVRLVLFELDAMKMVALDDYVNGAEIDLAKAVEDLRFWISNTEEFLQFMRELRAYNESSKTKVHLWGIDAQSTSPPIDVLTRYAYSLGMQADELALLAQLTGRAKAVLTMAPATRAKVDALLSRLETPRGASQRELLVALAAQSLQVQLGYWVGDMPTWYDERRDQGIARLAHLLITRSELPRACLWAHNAHISKLPGERALGSHLARLVPGYYAIGFFFYEGATRAWDEKHEIGVISHSFPPAPADRLEGALMTASRSSEAAWVVLSSAPPALAHWLEVPRFSRELGAFYKDNPWVLRDIQRHSTRWS